MLSKSVDKTIISVEYRLAPEYPFPAGLEDCYLAARALYQGKIFPKIEPGQISVMGDSSGGNLAAALCLLARDRGEFSIHKQILVYPAVNNCYTLDSAYDSIRENGEGYLLTRGKMHDYLQLYIGKQEDLKSPYVAPVLAEDLTNMPETLVLSAEFDPLRDEGEDYAKRLKEAGNKVTCYRIGRVIHGYLHLEFQDFMWKRVLRILTIFYGRGNDAEKRNVHSGESWIMQHRHFRQQPGRKIPGYSGCIVN